MPSRPCRYNHIDDALHSQIMNFETRTHMMLWILFFTICFFMCSMYKIIYRTLMSIATLRNQPRDAISIDFPSQISNKPNHLQCKIMVGSSCKHQSTDTKGHASTLENSTGQIMPITPPLALQRKRTQRITPRENRIMKFSISSPNWCSCSPWKGVQRMKSSEPHDFIPQIFLSHQNHRVGRIYIFAAHVACRNGMEIGVKIWTHFTQKKCYPKCFEFDPGQCFISTTQSTKTLDCWSPLFDHHHDLQLKAPNSHNRIGWRRHSCLLDRNNTQASVYATLFVPTYTQSRCCESSDCYLSLQGYRRTTVLITLHSTAFTPNIY